MKIDRIHFYVEDARASQDWFINCMGFQAHASGASYHTQTRVVKSGSVYIVLSSPLTAASPVAQFLRRYPPGVADVAFLVTDLDSVLKKAITKGAKVLQPVEQRQFADGSMKWVKIAAWGSLTHTLVERCGVAPLLPDINLAPEDNAEIADTYNGIDHVVLNVAAGDLERALSWYEGTLGFERQQSFAIETEQSGLRSQVLVHPRSGMQFPINEPTSINSQIQEFLDFNHGPGIQHIALQTPQIVQAIARLRQCGLCFLPIPQTYYTQLQDRHRGLCLLPEELEAIATQEILVDWQEDASDSLLLQIFTQPIFEQPTFFFELIERRAQAQGFGEGNFRALFEAIEREQHKRGSLK
jgi:4-hydroxyphenylpyruvate dioxygenase